ncbi:MAG: alpha/beta fold hydrolase [Anaerolineae bacterium]|nr:alpha/beta fold hydrolase [Anaerolineae bacterium]
MFKRTLRLIPVILTLLMLLILALPAAANGGESVTIINETDDLELVGLYYAPPEGDPAPAVLLMHHGGARKEAWVDLIPLLQEAGYATLTIDIRGHGDTGGSYVADLAIEDAHLWLAWLREQPGVDPDRVSIVGASLGADIGMQVMAQDQDLVTIIGISVLLQVDDMNAQTAIEQFGERPVYLVAATGVPDDAQAARTLFAVAPGEVQARLYDNTACCTYLFMFDAQLAPSFIDWLDRHN